MGDTGTAAGTQGKFRPNEAEFVIYFRGESEIEMRPGLRTDDIRLILVVAGAFLMTTPATSADNGDEAAIKKVYQTFATSWNTPGMPGFETIFTDDADFVVITGKWLKGRDEIVNYHRDLLKGVYAGSKFFIESVEVRFVRPDLAIVHFRSGANIQFGDKAAARTSLSTSTLVKVDGAWRITAFHNVLTGGPGYTFGPPAKVGDDAQKPK